MSGGSFDYAPDRFSSDFAERLVRKLRIEQCDCRPPADREHWWCSRHESPYTFDAPDTRRELMRVALVARIVADMAHDVEWYFSDDTCEETMRDDIRRGLRRLRRALRRQP